MNTYLLYTALLGLSSVLAVAVPLSLQSLDQLTLFLGLVPVVLEEEMYIVY